MNRDGAGVYMHALTPIALQALHSSSMAAEGLMRAKRATMRAAKHFIETAIFLLSFSVDGVPCFFSWGFVRSDAFFTNQRGTRGSSWCRRRAKCQLEIKDGSREGRSRVRRARNIGEGVVFLYLDILLSASKLGSIPGS